VVLDDVVEEEEEGGAGVLSEDVEPQAIPIGTHMRVMVRPYEGASGGDGITGQDTTEKRRRRMWDIDSVAVAPITTIGPAKEGPMLTAVAQPSRPRIEMVDEEEEEERKAFAAKMLRDRAKRAQQTIDQTRLLQVPSTEVRPKSAGQVPTQQAPKPQVHVQAGPTQTDRLYTEIEKLASRTSEVRDDELLRMAIASTKKKKAGGVTKVPAIPEPPLSSAATTQQPPRRQILMPGASRSRKLQPPPTTPLTEREQVLKQSLVQLTAVCERHSTNLEKIAEELAMLRLTAEQAQEGLPISMPMPIPVTSSSSRSSATTTVPPKSAQARLPQTKAKAKSAASRGRRAVTFGNSPLVTDEPRAPQQAALPGGGGGGRISLGENASLIL
jgi:hypothetical protein